MAEEDLTLADEVTDFGPDSIEGATDLVAETAVGSESPISAAMVTAAMLRSRNIKGDFTVAGISNHVFIVGFNYEEVKEKIPKGSPWRVRFLIVLLFDWPPHLPLERSVFRPPPLGFMHELPHAEEAAVSAP